MGNSKQTRIFDLKEVGYTDLDGKFVSINFDHKDFANALFANAQSIEMDDFARALHRDGKAELTEQVANELPTIVSSIYKRRVAEALKDTLLKFMAASGE